MKTECYSAWLAWGTKTNPIIMKTFEQFKEEFKKACKKKNACEDEYKRVLASENFQQLLKVITDNSYWCYDKGVINADILSEIPEEELLSANIYVNKKNVVQKDGVAYYYNSTSKHYGNSTSKHYYNSTSEHYDNSTSEHYDNSTSEHYGNSTYGSVWVMKPESIHDKAIVRERSTGKVYFKKNAFEITEIE